jgi:hypothetical protein
LGFFRSANRYLYQREIKIENHFVTKWFFLVNCNSPRILLWAIFFAF